MIAWLFDQQYHWSPLGLLGLFLLGRWTGLRFGRKDYPPRQ